MRPLPTTIRVDQLRVGDLYGERGIVGGIAKLAASPGTREIMLSLPAVLDETGPDGEPVRYWKRSEVLTLPVDEMVTVIRPTVR